MKTIYIILCLLSCNYSFGNTLPPTVDDSQFIGYRH